MMVHCPPNDVLLSHCRQAIPHAATSSSGPDRFGTMEAVGHSGLVDRVAGSRCHLPRASSSRGRRILICLAWAPALEMNK